jgi:hypothetical protein
MSGDAGYCCMGTGEGVSNVLPLSRAMLCWSHSAEAPLKGSSRQADRARTILSETLLTTLFFHSCGVV